jgi:pimeloyl-ACP methyl ester carboxylesterase
MVKLFSIDGRKIACWINPRDFGVHQQSLIFIHGSGSDHSGWSLQYSKLHKQFNIVAIDLPGHGGSPGNGEDEVDKYIVWIKKLLDIIKLKNPVLIGHSLGAAITLKFALHYPQDVKGIIPVGGGIKMPVNPDLLAGLKTNPAAVIDLICKFSLAKENRPKLFDPLKKSLSKANVDALYGDLSACNKLDLTNDIGKICTPALVLCGTEDKMTPADFSRQIAAGINGAKLCLIEGAGHMVMLEKPELFNDAIANFAISISG